jgi:hypothetical protein
MIILNTRVQRKIQKYNGLCLKKLTYYKKYLKSCYQNNIYKDLMYKPNTYHYLIDNSVFSHIEQQYETIKPITKFTLNYQTKIIRKITFTLDTYGNIPVDEFVIDYIELKIGGCTIDQCYQIYFKNLRKLYNLDSNDIPIYTICNGLLNSDFHEQCLYIYFKNNIILPQNMYIQIYYYDITTTNIDIDATYYYPIYQNIVCNTNYLNLLLNKILIPLDISVILFEINQFKIKLKRIDYYNKVSLFSLSEFFESNNILDYGLELALMKNKCIYNAQTNKRIDINICFIVANILCYNTNLWYQEYTN